MVLWGCGVWSSWQRFKAKVRRLLELHDFSKVAEGHPVLPLRAMH